MQAKGLGGTVPSHGGTSGSISFLIAYLTNQLYFSLSLLKKIEGVIVSPGKWGHLIKSRVVLNKDG